MQETRRRLEAAPEAIQQAEENLRVIRKRYSLGTATNTEVLDARPSARKPTATTTRPSMKPSSRSYVSATRQENCRWAPHGPKCLPRKIDDWSELDTLSSPIQEIGYCEFDLLRV